MSDYSDTVREILNPVRVNPIRSYRFEVIVDDRTDKPICATMNWRCVPAAAIAKFTRMMEARHPGKSIEVICDWD